MSRSEAGLRSYDSLRASSRMLLGLAPVAQAGLIVAGVGLFLNEVADLLGDAQLTWGERRVIGVVALVTLGGCALGGWVIGRLLRALGGLIDVMVDQAESAQRTADLLEWHLVPALERAAVALERSSAAPAQSGGRSLAAAGARQAIGEGRWEQAERLIEGFARDFPEAADERATLANELAEARREAIDDLRSRLDAAQAANDPDQVIEYRDELTRHLNGTGLKELDRHVIKWLMGLIQRRMRTGTVRPDVARLAARAADSFGDTVEGASLRAALPTLRRSAGLCPKCAEPYTGIESACPRCGPKQAESPPILGMSAQEQAP